MVDQALATARVWLWLDPSGAPVSLARRQAEARGAARIGPVYTPPGLRGRGYGSAVTAAATREVLDGGAVPVLFTDLGNPTSNAIYQQLGYRPVSDHLLIKFPD
jgi:predicted GNAT family acetyltransferase